MKVTQESADIVFLLVLAQSEKIRSLQITVQESILPLLYSEFIAISFPLYLWERLFGGSEYRPQGYFWRER